MEKRPYFVIGDLLVNAGAGALVATVCAGALAGMWPPVVGMVVGMVVGGLMGMLCAIVASFALGAFEVMLPVMTTGMLVGMLAATRGGEAVPVSAGGAVVGVGVVVVTYLLNARLRGQGGAWTP